MVWTLVRHAVFSRALFLVLTWLIGCFWTAFDESVLLSGVSPHLHGFLRWDGIFDVAIAEHGYRFEQEYAFGPFYPTLIRQVTALLRCVLSKYVNDATLYTFSGVLVSNTAFLLASLALYRLTCLTFKDTSYARRVTLAFLYNPAIAFTGAVSKEPVLALLSFAGLYAFETQHFWLASGAFGFAALTRSNGVLLGGFFLHRAFCLLVAPPDNVPLSRRCLAIVTSCMLGVLPYLAFATHQAWAADALCLDVDRPYCEHRALRSYLLPKLHGYVQSAYWHVRPFQYWQTSELGNWLLASGFLLLSWTHLRQHYMRAWQLNAPMRRRLVDCLVASRSCYYHHWTLFVFYLMVMSHIQVITRVFMSLPAVWWALADRYWDVKHASTRSKWRQWAFWYGSTGLVLYATFYPPA